MDRRAASVRLFVFLSFPRAGMSGLDKQNPSLVSSGDRKITTQGPTLPVGNEACRVSPFPLNGGPEGWDFSGTSEP